MKEQEEHNEIRDLLRNLDRVTASEDFENKLQLRIIEEERRRRAGHSKKFAGILDFIQQFLSGKSNPWLVPATGFVVLIFFVLYMVYNARFNTEQNLNSEQVNLQNSDSDSVRAGSEIALHETKPEISSGMPEPVQSVENTDRSAEVENRQGLRENKTGTSREIETPAVHDDFSKDLQVEKPDVQAAEISTGTDRKDESVKEETGPPAEVMKAPDAGDSHVSEMPKEINLNSDEETGKERTGETERKSAIKPDKSNTDSLKKVSKKKLEQLDRKWLEEIEKKINETVSDK